MKTLNALLAAPTAETLRNRKGFTLVELLVVIAIIALLVTVTSVGVAKAFEHSRTLKCKSNLRSLTQGALLYSNQNNGRITPVWTQNAKTAENWFWYADLAPYIGTENLSVAGGNAIRFLICPKMKLYSGGGWTNGYGMNDQPNYPTTTKTMHDRFDKDGNRNPSFWFTKPYYMYEVQNPDERLYIADFLPSKYNIGAKEKTSNFPLGRHGIGKMNASFFDGSVRTLNLAQIRKALDPTY